MIKKQTVHISLSILLLILLCWPILAGIIPLSYFPVALSHGYAIFCGCIYIFTFISLFYMWVKSDGNRKIFYYVLLLVFSPFVMLCWAAYPKPIAIWGPPIPLKYIIIFWGSWLGILGLLILDYLVKDI